jgi:glycosyltransferase involved in cell wall biosynthesis
MESMSFTEHRVPGPPPKVSVLLPNRNYARFIPEALLSLLDQDFTDFELIISDDASTDDSAAVIGEFARRDGRIRFTRQPTRLGLVENFNWCLSQARGEYIKFLLADDKLASKDALGRLVTTLDQHPRIVLASCSAWIMNERSELEFVRDYLRQDLVEDGQTTCRRCLLSGINQIGEPSLTIFRRRCVGNGFNPAYRHWVDVEFSFRVLEQGWFAYRAEPLAAFRFHAGQQTRLDHKEHLHLTEFYRLLLDFADRPWLGRKAARQRLFEELYQGRKGSDLPSVPRAGLNAALECLGRAGYEAFKARRNVRASLERLHHSLAKRLSSARPFSA